MSSFSPLPSARVYWNILGISCSFWSRQTQSPGLYVWCSLRAGVCKSSFLAVTWHVTSMSQLHGWMQADMSSLCLCSRRLGQEPALVWKPHNSLSFSTRQVNLSTAVTQLQSFWTGFSQSKETWTCLCVSMQTSFENPTESPLVNNFNFHSLWNNKRPQFLGYCAVPFDFSLCREHNLKALAEAPQ